MLLQHILASRANMNYYHTKGQKVELKPVINLVAVKDTPELQDVGIYFHHVTLNGQSFFTRIIPRDKLAANEEIGLLFRQENALMLLLPEVKIEQITGSVVIATHISLDALNLANELVEKYGLVASPRFLRLVSPYQG